MANSVKKKIVAIDDSETNLVLLQAVLEDSGYDVILMNNSSEAVEYIHNNNPDLILLDLLMPDMDGFDFMERLQSVPGSHKSPVLVITADVNPQNTRKAKSLGALDVIYKPINIQSFILKINQLIKQ